VSAGPMTTSGTRLATIVWRLSSACVPRLTLREQPLLHLGEDAREEDGVLPTLPTICWV
jgi:hypothetical protein